MEFTQTTIYHKAFNQYLRRGTPIEVSVKALLAIKTESDPEKKPKSYYVWVTQGDDKVRPSHAANEGQIFSYDDPPDTGHPGDEGNCRCSAEPYDNEPQYPDAIDPVYPELLFLPLLRFGRLVSGLIRAVDDINAATLNAAQAKNLGRFDSKLPKDAGKIEILSGKNGERTFRADVPARNVPGSFARYEKVVDSSGKTVSYTKTTYAPDGRIVHVKIK